MAIKLENELTIYGCDVDPEEFRDIVMELKAVMFPMWTDEELLCHCDHDAPMFCRAVRSRVRCDGLPDHLITRTLLNVRKKSQA